VRIGGDLQGGSASSGDLIASGYIQAQRIASLFLGGSLIAGVNSTPGSFQNNGAIRVADDIGSVTIGNLIGNSTNPAIISARGSATPTATTDVAIGKITITGRVEFAQILAGFDLNFAAVNADAQIGPVSVAGDWIASSIAAGVVAGGDHFFGDGDDSKMSGAGVKDVATVFSRITSLSIAGQVLGTPPTLNNSDFFGIEAENVGALKIGGTTIPLTAGHSNDNFFLGITGDFKVHEL
jgi:hypothetical protein